MDQVRPSALRTGVRALAIVAAVSPLIPTTAQAKTPTEEKIVCIQSFERGQRYRQEGKLRDAREQLLVCSRDACPAMVRKDCASTLDSVEVAMPTVVIIVRDTAGVEVPDATVVVDGTPIDAWKDGRAIPLDPGPRSFHVVAPGSPAFDQKVIIHEAEKSRTLVFMLDRSSAPHEEGAGGGNGGGGGEASGGGSSSSGSGERSAAGSAGPTVGGHTIYPWLVTGLGVVVAAGGIVYWTMGQKDVSDGQAICPNGICKTNADKIDSDNLQQRGETRTHVGIGVAVVGGLLAVGGIAWHFLEPPARPVTISSNLASPYIRPEVGPGYAGVACTAHFH